MVQIHFGPSTLLASGVRRFDTSGLRPLQTSGTSALRDFFGHFDTSRPLGDFEASDFRTLATSGLFDTSLWASALWEIHALLISRLPKLISLNTWIGCHLSPLRSTTHACFGTSEFSLRYTWCNFEILNTREPLI
jgi:hypothetical protein